MSLRFRMTERADPADAEDDVSRFRFGILPDQFRAA